MPATLSLTEAQTFQAIGNVLLGFVLAGTEVIRGQVNRVPQPLGDYVTMVTLRRARLDTNIDIYTDTSVLMLQPTEHTVQLDVHGPNAGDNAQIIVTTMKDEAGCSAFAATGFDVMPLYASDARQMAFPTGENQFEDRWVIDLVLQVNPVVTLPQQSATTAVTGIISVDAAYPPGA